MAEKVYLIDSNILNNIAVLLRIKKYNSSKYNVEQMISEIKSIPYAPYQGGYNPPVNTLGNCNFSTSTTTIGVTLIGSSVTNMAYAFANNTSVLLIPTCGSNVTNMYFAYYNCRNLTGSPACGPNVTDMSSAYKSCYNLTGSPVCGPNVTNMTGAYDGCGKLTGSPVCGNNVTSMCSAYSGCRNLTGSPVCGPNVTNMSSAYYGCSNLTGSPVCGPNVTSMRGAYSYSSITGSPVCGNNVTDMRGAYSYCSKKLYGDMYMNYTGNTMSSNVDAYQCFYGRNTSNRLNIHVKAGYAWNNWLYNVGTLCNSTKLTWTTMTNGYYNGSANIYVYYNA